jgi:DNA-binding MarR family transcriptional regulator
MADHESFDPLAEAHRQWQARWPGQADRMAAVTSVMRVQQLLLARVEDVLKPCGITFAAYETLRLLAFTKTGSLPMGKLGTRLMVHPAAVTNAIGKLEQRGLVGRSMSPDDRRVVIATITDRGRSLVDEATAALNDAAFGLPDLAPEQAADVVIVLHSVRAAAGDLGPVSTALRGWPRKPSEAQPRKKHDRATR